MINDLISDSNFESNSDLIYDSMPDVILDLVSDSNSDSNSDLISDFNPDPIFLT